MTRGQLDTKLRAKIKDRVQYCIRETLDEFTVNLWQCNPDVVAIAFSVPEFSGSEATNLREAFVLSAVYEQRIEILHYKQDSLMVRFTIGLKENGLSA